MGNGSEPTILPGLGLQEHLFPEELQFKLNHAYWSLCNAPVNLKNPQP